MVVAVAFSSVRIAAAAAQVEIVSETATAMTVRFHDNNSQILTVSLTRASSADAWLGPVSTTQAPGVVFGRTNPVYASTSSQRALGVSAQGAVRPFSSAIASSPLSDVTVFRITPTALAVGLWQQNRIVEIWYVGEFVHAFLGMLQQLSACQRMEQLCCRDKECDDDNNPETPKVMVHNGLMEACRRLWDKCPGKTDEACACILKNCSFCLVPNNATACTNCGLGALSDAACLLHFDLCDPGPPDPRPAPDDVDELLEEVANRLDVRIDAGD